MCMYPSYTNLIIAWDTKLCVNLPCSLNVSKNTRDQRDNYYCAYCVCTFNHVCYIIACACIIRIQTYNLILPLSLQYIHVHVHVHWHTHTNTECPDECDRCYEFSSGVACTGTRSIHMHKQYVHIHVYDIVCNYMYMYNVFCWPMTPLISLLHGLPYGYPRASCSRQFAFKNSVAISIRQTGVQCTWCMWECINT